MATNLDLQEQEQLDELKAFWKKYGNPITAVLMAALTAYAGWTAWQWWQRDQATKAGAVYEELDRAATAGDAERVARVFADLRDRYPRTTWAAQGGLLTAQQQFDKGQPDAAATTLAWVVEHARVDELKTLARLRLAAVQWAQKQPDAALKTLEPKPAPGFEGLVADRRGDLLLAQGKADEARAAYQAAYAALGERVDYRRLVEAKLASLGAAPQAAPAAASGAAK